MLKIFKTNIEISKICHYRVSPNSKVVHNAILQIAFSASLGKLNLHRMYLEPTYGCVDDCTILDTYFVAQGSNVD